MTVLILAMLFLPSENQLIIDFITVSSIREKKKYYVLITGYMLDKKFFPEPKNKQEEPIHSPLFAGSLCSGRVKHIT
jgi:hypothetical protein